MRNTFICVKPDCYPYKSIWLATSEMLRLQLYMASPTKINYTRENKMTCFQLTRIGVRRYVSTEGCEDAYPP